MHYCSDQKYCAFVQFEKLIYLRNNIVNFKTTYRDFWCMWRYFHKKAEMDIYPCREKWGLWQ